MDDALLLELLNSAPRVDGVIVDAWPDEGAFNAWLKGVPASGLDAARGLRADLRQVARGEKSPDELNRWLAGARNVPSIEGGELVWRLEAEDQLAAGAVIALLDLRTRLPGRLRACGNPECELFLLDTSRSNTGRWCDMATCGNRMKARRHQARLRSG